MKTKITLSLLFVVGVATSCGNSSTYMGNNTQTNKVNTVDYQYDQNKKSKFMETHFKNEMPIFGYFDMPMANVDGGDNPSFNNIDPYILYKDAGFNAVIPTYQKAPTELIAIHRDIEVCNQLGMKYLIRDLDFLCDQASMSTTPSQESYYNHLKEEKEWYLNQPSVIGIQTKDEPNNSDFDAMGNFYRALTDVDDTKWAFTTLFPSYASAEQLKVEEYVKTMSLWEAYKIYVENYIVKTNSAYVLYDYYYNQIRTDALTPSNTKGFMSSLSFFNHIADKYGIDFMAAVASYKRVDDLNMTPKETTWTVNMTLAYGARGIEYYTYWPTTVAGREMTAWKTPSRAGLVTPNGIPHDLYYQAKEINENIKVVDEYLMNAKFKGIQYYGEETLYIEEKDIIPPAKQNLLYDITGGDAFVGVFDYKGKTIYYVVNNSFTCGNQNFILKFHDKHKIHLLNSQIDKTIENTSITGLNLSAGKAVLVEVD